MESLDVLVSLYSALIQGGATLVAVVGGFVLSAILTVRSSAHSMDRGIDTMRQAVQHLSTELPSLAEQAKALDEKWLTLASEAHQQLLLGKTTQDEFERTIKAHRKARRREAKELTEIGDQLAKRGTAVIEQSSANKALIYSFDEDFRWFFRAATLLMTLVIACVLCPAIVLSQITTDPDPSFTAIASLLAYVLAILLIPLFALEATSSNPPPKIPIIVARLLNLAIIVCVLLAISQSLAALLRAIR